MTKVVAGKPVQIEWGDGNWIFWDVGFATETSSCGLAIGDGEPDRFQFGRATQKIVEHLTRAESLTSLVIEAPLSVCFNKKGNPTGRLIELADIKGTPPRYWHQACGIMVAAMYLIRAISEASPKHCVRLFEGFVSYKDKGTSDHRDDVKWLRRVVREPEKFEHCIVSGDALKADQTDNIVSAFRVCGFDCGVPAVIKRPFEQPR